jgi:hypothetical protein
MDIFLGPTANIIPDEFSSQNSGKEAMKLPLIYMTVLQLPFLGLWISIFKGSFEPTFSYFIIAYFLLASVLIRSIIGYRKINFGYDADGVFMKKYSKFVRIPWEKLESIELVREFKEFNEIDMFPINDLYQRNRFLYRFKGNNSKFTVSQYYSESDKFSYWVSRKSKKKVISRKWSMIDWVFDNNI